MKSLNVRVVVLLTISVFFLACGTISNLTSLSSKTEQNDTVLKDNLLHNGNFEQGISSWATCSNNGKIEFQITEGFESLKGLLINRDISAGYGDAYCSQRVELDPNRTTHHYRLTYWMKVMNLEGGKGGVVRLTFYDTRGKKLGHKWSKYMLTPQKGQVLTEGNRWQQIEHKKTKNWTNYDTDFFVPENAAHIAVDTGIFGGVGTVHVDRLYLLNTPSVDELFSDASDISAVIAPKPFKQNIHPLLFSANTNYIFPGVYYGTLPSSHPESRREEFARTLKACGIKCMRFPGGMSSHYYIHNSEEAYRQFLGDYQQITGQKPSGKYFSYPRNHYTSLEDFLQFCLEYGFEPLYETNTLYYYDGRRCRPTVHHRRLAEKNEYDRDRVEEAAQDLAHMIDRIHSKGLRIKYWEIGNEEFALMSCEQYADIVAAFSKVIKDKVTDAEILITGNYWPTEICVELNKRSSLSRIDYLTFHYLYGDHWLPDPIDDVRNMKRYVMGEVHCETNLGSHRLLVDRGGGRNIKLAGTESNIFTFHTWDAHRVNWTGAHGLLYTYLWGNSILQPGLDVHVYHNLLSPYFGMLKYNSSYDPELKKFEWIPNDMEKKPDHIPDNFWFKDQYFITPAGKVNALLSNYAGMDFYEASVEGASVSQTRSAKLFIGADEEKILVTVVNRSSKDRKVNIDLGSLVGNRSSILGGKSYYWDSLDADPLEDHFSDTQSGSIDGKTLHFDIKGLSVTQLKISR